VTEQPKELEEASPHAADPQLHGQRADAVPLRDLLDRVAGKDVLGGGEGDLGARDLPRQSVVRQKPLSVPATQAPRERDLKNEEGFRRVKLSRNAASHNPQVRSRAPGTMGAGEELRPRTGDHLLIRRRVNFENVNHGLARRPR
jgi:hypothetical protein